MTDHPQEPADRAEPLSESAQTYGDFKFVESTPEQQAQLWKALAETEHEFHEMTKAKLEKARADLTTTRQRLKSLCAELASSLGIDTNMSDEALRLEIANRVATTRQERDALVAKIQKARDILLGCARYELIALEGGGISMHAVDRAVAALAEIERLKGDG